MTKTHLCKMLMLLNQNWICNRYLPTAPTDVTKLPSLPSLKLWLSLFHSDSSNTCSTNTYASLFVREAPFRKSFSDSIYLLNYIVFIFFLLGLKLKTWNSWSYSSCFPVEKYNSELTFLNDEAITADTGPRNHIPCFLGILWMCQSSCFRLTLNINTSQSSNNFLEQYIHTLVHNNSPGKHFCLSQ